MFCLLSLTNLKFNNGSSFFSFLYKCHKTQRSNGLSFLKKIKLIYRGVEIFESLSHFEVWPNKLKVSDLVQLKEIKFNEINVCQF